GADEALDILAKTFVDPGTCALVASPTYSMYRISVELLDGRIIEVARRPDFSDNVEALIEQCKRPEARMVFLCSPNNPTGNLSKREDVVRLLETVECAVVVDEAYAEFAGESLVDLTGKYENLIIVRTFSKAFGMAGVRIGYMVAHPETIRLLSKARPPNSVSTISLTLAKLALENRDEILPKIEEIKRERERLAGRLAELPNVEVYPSQANFILARFEQADKVYSELLKRGMVLRRVSGPLLENCLRITVLDRKANDRLITSLKEVLGVKS
ncbi:MAG: histidinol-phosphate transaminase, partial [Candidatus Hecatellales archaeon]